jgi:uncharacterized protein YbbC (DUF1343 family)
LSASRRAFLAGAACFVAAPVRAAARVQVGLDRVVDEAQLWRGRRVAVLAHDASRDASGAFVTDVLQKAGARVVRLLAPEHGLKSRRPAGEVVEDESWRGIPVISLYGARSGIGPGHLEGVDMLAVDLQDVGVRFYTYPATALDAIAAARRAGIAAVVLDRPDPLGGLVVEGPRADPGASGIFARVPGPLVHGLTMGEIARLAHGDAVRVVRLAGWSRALRWGATGCPWVPPSPNLRTPEAALAYPGTALLEATNVSEGRGTEAPFLTFGAPWLPPDVASRIPPVAGYELSRRAFTPRGSGVKHAGRTCQGVSVRVTDQETTRPYELGVTILHTLRRLPGFEWLDGGRAIDRLVSSGRVRQAIDEGLPPAQIVAQDREAHTAWLEERTPALIY